MKITEEWLKKIGACRIAKNILSQAFNGEAEVTAENIESFCTEYYSRMGGIPWGEYNACFMSDFIDENYCTGVLCDLCIFKNNDWNAIKELMLKTEN